MNTGDLEKIKLIDQVFNSLSLDDVKSILSADLLVGKLKAHDNSTGTILGAFQELSMLQVEMITLRADHNFLKEDFKVALKVMHTLSIPVTPMPTYSPELQNLKSKYNVY